MHVLQKALNEIYGDQIELRSYSGRGMYGRSCLAVVLSQEAINHLKRDVVEYAVDEIYSAAIDCEDDEAQLKNAFDTKAQMSELLEAMVTFKTDNMGLDFVIYWPDVRFEKPIHDESEDEG